MFLQLPGVNLREKILELDGMFAESSGKIIKEFS